MQWLATGMADVPSDTSWLAPLEAARAASMRFAKRRSEFVLSRWNAKRALARVLEIEPEPPELARIEVRPAWTGAPVAHLDGEPTGIAVSLTDRADWAVCVVSRHAPAVGCDLELVEPRSSGFVADFLTAAERAVVAAASSDEVRHLTANLLWSAKESALKVLQTGLRRDTRSVEVALDVGEPIDGWSPLRVRAAEGAEFPGWWRRYGTFVLTVAGDRPVPPPASLVEPAPLSLAEPSHGWLGRPAHPR